MVKRARTPSDLVHELRRACFLGYFDSLMLSMLMMSGPIGALKMTACRRYNTPVVSPMSM
jgi:hypothetical protein